MGSVSSIKLTIVIICLACASLFIYWEPSSKASVKNISLSDALSDIDGWKREETTLLDQRIIDALELDDYTNRNYTNGKETISLYIGYYFSTEKIGAAHSPLVCFPGQGWLLSNMSKGKFLPDQKNEESISYTLVMAERGQGKQLIIYWFQSYDRTNPDTLSQKIASFWSRMVDQREDNAFVRISTPMNRKSLSESRETIFKFIRAFYPVFIDYVKQG
ncbi:MAG: EpsI family protein [Thermodesulfobacteriota bacterium]|nr:EpsI family protein [Thermodesulfobacteriota bacterium]